MQAKIPEGKPTHLADGTPIDPRNYLFSGIRPIDEKGLTLWNDVRWDRAKNNMTTEQLKQYKKIGEQMNGSIDFVTGNSNIIPIPEPSSESISYIISGLRSGLNSDDLDEDEIIALKTFIGEDWESKIFISSKQDNDVNDQSHSEKTKKEN